jgi:ribose transport system substrate-binding protein
MTEVKRVVHLRGRIIRVALSVVAALVLAGAVGCGDDDSQNEATGAAGGGGGEGLAEARQIVREAERPLEFQFAGEPFDATEARGKNVWFIGVSLEVPFVKTWLTGMREALGTVGAEVTAFDGKGQVSEMNRGIQQAIAANADAIFIGSGQIKALSASAARAESAGIPVINGMGGKPQIPRDVPGVVAEVTVDFEQIGELVAAWTLADQGDDEGNVLAIESSDVDATEHYVRGLTETFERLAPDRSLDVEDVPVAQWQTRLPTLTRTAVQRDPELSHLIPLYDGMTLSVLPALTQAGAADRVRIASTNATPVVLESLEKGTPVKADVGTPTNWLGWASADQVLRVITDNPPVEDEQIPVRLFTENNIGELDIEGDESSWYGDVDLGAEYGKIWGVSG